LKLDFVVLMGLAISFIGAFLFSYLKIIEIQDFKGQTKKNDENNNSREEIKENENARKSKSENFIVYIIEPQIKG